jgi:hypothetical protein
MDLSAAHRHLSVVAAMTNKPKAIGTRGESGVVMAARRLGFPHARRLALHGSGDLGDVELTQGVMAEVKAGQSAKQASLAQIDQWWLDTLREAANYYEDTFANTVPLLVVQRAAYSPDRAEYWRTFMDVKTVADLQLIRGTTVHEHAFPVEMTFIKACLLLRGYGYGSALVGDAS